MGIPPYGSAPLSPAAIAKFPQPIGYTSFDENVIPTLQRYAGNPVFRAGNQNPALGAYTPTTSPTIYHPWVVDMSVTPVGSSFNKFHMYYSTDHSTGDGGIWFASAPTPYGPWTGRGFIFSDTTSSYGINNQTEDPVVIWIPEVSLFYMYYHQLTVTGANGIMSTMLATSTNGVTGWTKRGIMIDVPTATSFPGDGATGYFKPFRLGARWYAYHLLGGTSYPHFGISQSDDGLVWSLDPRPLGYGTDQTVDGRRIEWNDSKVFHWRGQLWWLGYTSVFVAGVELGNSRLAIAPISSNLRQLLGPPIYQLYPPVGANESTNYKPTGAFVYQGKLIFYYQCDGNFNIATAG